MIGGVGLDILKMTYVSYLLTGIAVLSGIMTVALFFLYDIPRCVRIVRGGGRSAFAGAAASDADTVHRKKERRAKPIRRGKTEKLAFAGKTELLDKNAKKSTVLLTAEDTTPLETMYLVQDITMMEAKP